MNDIMTPDHTRAGQDPESAAPSQPAGRSGTLALVAAIGAGASVMYFLDPDRGRRRRHLVRDKLVHQLHEARETVETTGRDLANRSRGVAANVRHRFEARDVDEAALTEPTFELLREHWTPGARLVAAVTGGALAASALRDDERRTPLSTAMGLLGAALVVRSTTNLAFDRLVGAGRRAIGVQKAIIVAAPIGDVFNWLIAWEHWPRWMSHVREVRSTAGGGAEGERTHWIVDGPAGTTVEWDALTTRFVPPELIAWRTVEGSPVAHAGTLRLVPTDDGFTRLDVRMAYNPIAGAAGHLVAALFRRDPRRQLGDDLARLKTTIESGIPPRDAAARTASRDIVSSVPSR
ncbi:MAG: SRPBCC family protein [Gemmatimonadaceae bacterium]